MMSSPKNLWAVAVKELSPLLSTTAGQEARWLMERILKLSAAEIIMDKPFHLTANQKAKFEDALSRRRNGEPLAYITGEQEFCGFNFIVTPDVLIPREDSQCLVQVALRSNATSVLDMGVGSGCIGLAIIKQMSKLTTLVGLDVSQAAIEVAKKNAIRLAVTDRANFHQVDACDEESVRKILNKKLFDLIVANPPYIDPNDTEVESAVRRYEPHVALYSADEGLAHIKTWLKIGLPYLRPNGVMAFEIGYRQGDTVAQLFRATNEFVEVYTEKDTANHNRVIWGRKGL